jgi:hypothetical protein
MEVVGFVLLGLLSGFAASTLGIGGGVIFVPSLAVLFAFPQHIAQGTSLAVILPTAILGTYLHAKRGRVHTRTAILVASAGIVGGLAGSFLALSLPADLLRRLFAGLLILIAIRMISR